jgi:predicted GIY-YIG superfamily endonuclease
MLNFYVYILQCCDGSFYTGHTDNLEKRIAEHQAGSYEGYTASRLPIKLVFVETCSSRAEALEAERKIKTWNKKKKEVLANKGWEGIIALRKRNSQK